MEQDAFDRMCEKFVKGLEKAYAKRDLERESAYRKMAEEGNISIENLFNLKYIGTGIKLPEDAAEKGKGIIENGPTLIYYAFGEDEKGKHLNVYSTNRFCWGADHFRIYENGKEMDMPSEQDIILLPPDYTQEEEERKMEEMQKHNRSVYELLEKEGIRELMDMEFISFMDSMKISQESVDLK